MRYFYSTKLKSGNSGHVEVKNADGKKRRKKKRRMENTPTGTKGRRKKNADWDKTSKGKRRRLKKTSNVTNVD